MTDNNEQRCLDNESATKNVLAIDGGGVRGVLPAMILAEIEKRTRKPAHELFDVISGTSTGAFLGAMLTRADNAGGPIPAAETVDRYMKDSAIYFTRQSDGIWAPMFKGNKVKNLMKNYFGDADLAGARQRLIVPVYELRKNVPRVFYFSSLAASQEQSSNFPIWQVIRAATAAPAMFSTFRARSLDGVNEHWIIDGGVYANNPAVLGWLHAYQGFDGSRGRDNFAERFPIADNADVRNTLVVGLGTGRAEWAINPHKARKWGMVGWSRKFLNVVFEGQSDLVNDQMESAMNACLVRSYRLQPDLKKEIHAGDASEIDCLVETGESYIKTNCKKIDKICEDLLASR